MISTPVVLAVLLAALMHASWNVLLKASRDRLLDTVALALGGSVLGALALPFTGSMAAAAYPWMAASLCVHVAYFATLVRAYQHADLSLAYPLMRGLAPVLVALVAPLFGEPASPALLLGVALIAVGIVLPSLLGYRAGMLQPVGLGYALINAIFIALYSLFDGQGARAAGSPQAYTATLFAFNAWGITALALWLRGPRLLSQLCRRWRFALGGAVLSLGAYGIVLAAMTVAPIAAVAALRETSVIFAALMGTRFLREKMLGTRIGGALLIAAGVVVMRWV